MYETWEELENSIKDCKKCKLCKTRQNIVFGTGNKNADLMFIGEGPGADEDAKGEPGGNPAARHGDCTAPKPEAHGARPLGFRDFLQFPCKLRQWLPARFRPECPLPDECFEQQPHLKHE